MEKQTQLSYAEKLLYQRSRRKDIGPEKRERLLRELDTISAASSVAGSSADRKETKHGI